MFSLQVCVYTKNMPDAHGVQESSDTFHSEVRWLWGTMWVLEIKLRSYVRATHALNQSQLSSPVLYFSYYLLHITMCANHNSIIEESKKYADERFTNNFQNCFIILIRQQHKG